MHDVQWRTCYFLPRIRGFPLKIQVAGCIMGIFIHYMGYKLINDIITSQVHFNYDWVQNAKKQKSNQTATKNDVGLIIVATVSAATVWWNLLTQQYNFSCNSLISQWCHSNTEQKSFRSLVNSHIKQQNFYHDMVVVIGGLVWVATSETVNLGFSFSLWEVR